MFQGQYIFQRIEGKKESKAKPFLLIRVLSGHRDELDFFFFVFFISLCFGRAGEQVSEQDIGSLGPYSVVRVTAARQRGMDWAHISEGPLSLHGLLRKSRGERKEKLLFILSLHLLKSIQFLTHCLFCFLHLFFSFLFDFIADVWCVINV